MPRNGSPSSDKHAHVQRHRRPERHATKAEWAVSRTHLDRGGGQAPV